MTDRFTIEHGVVHDIKTGRHLTQSIEDDYPQQLCDLLNEQERTIDGYREALLVLVELKRFKRRIEAGTANADMKRYYEANKEGAWLGAEAMLVGCVRTEELSKLKKPAQVGNTIFEVGVSERMVIGRAQREHEYQQTPEKEAERLTRVEAFRHALVGPHVTDAMVDRFLSWRLPATVCADVCATNPSYPHPRSGTNLLNAVEARQMLEYVLVACVVSPQRRSPQCSACQDEEACRVADKCLDSNPYGH